MVYFPESVIITTKDGIQFKSFSNEHPEGFIIAKPKYIPVHYVFSDKLQFRNLFHKQVNRLNMWIDKKELKYYLQAIKESYPKYFYNNVNRESWFFAIPRSEIKQIFDPREGLKSLLEVPSKRDKHLKKVLEFVEVVKKSGVSIEDLGITFSTVVGHYDKKYSDINIVIYGKKNSWKVIEHLGKIKDQRIRWKSEEEWETYRRKRNRFRIFSKEEFCNQMSRKKTEGFFEDTLFVLFSVPKEEESWENWEDRHEGLGTCEVEGIVTNDSDSLFRPGRYLIKEGKVLEGEEKKIKEIVFYSRDYVMQVFKGEKIRAYGLLEKVINVKTKKEHYRVVVGYPDSYLTDRREREYLKKVNGRV